MAARGVSQMQLAATMGLSQTAVSKRLRGVTPFDVNDLEAIAHAFGVRPMALLDDGGRATMPNALVTRQYRRFRSVVGSRRERLTAVAAALPVAA